MLTEINTESKVTKLNKVCDDFCNQLEEIDTAQTIVEIIESPSSDKTEQNTFSLTCLKFFKQAVSKVSSIKPIAKNIICKKLTVLKKLFAKAFDLIKSIDLKLTYNNIKNKLNFLLRKISTESGIKLIISGGLALVCLVICLCTCSVGYKVTINGKTLGLIPSKQMYDDVYKNISENVFSMTGQDFSIPSDAELTMTIALNRNFQSEEQFAESLKSISSDMVPAYTVLIDNKMVVALPSESMALSALNEYKNSFSSFIKEAKLEFANDVEVCYMFAPKAMLHSKDAAVTYLLNGDFSYFKAEKDTTVSELAQKTGVSESLIFKANKLDGNSITKNQVIKLYSGRMFVDVMATQHVQREEVIPFDTVEEESDEFYQGITKVKTKGTDGLKSVDEFITYINGIEIQRDILHESVIKAPTAQVEFIGTKEPPPSVGTGSLSMPTSGSLSSRFGSRWGREHQGIDLSASVGTPIYAADNGTVIYSEYNNGGYGYMIQIDHGNGLKTYYAHCSELLVENGEIVAKGDLIAKVGNTGRSTGAHLHFEVRQDDVPIDPFEYLN